MTSPKASWARRLALASLGLAGAWAILSFANLSDFGNGVRFGSPFSDHGLGQTLLFTTPVQAPAIVAMVLLELAAAIVGYGLVVKPLWGGRNLAAPNWLLLAGVVPGHLFVTAVVRLVTLVVPNAAAPALVALLVAGVAAAVLVREAPRLAAQAGFRAEWVWTSLAALAATLLFQLHFDVFHALGDGAVWFVDFLWLDPEHGLGAPGRWPLFLQHYDEAAILYPVAMGLVSPDESASGTLTTLYWMLNAVGRLGALSFIYIAFRALSLDRLSALALLFFVCGATLSLNPISSRLLFDSLNPLGFALHEARILAPMAPVLIVAMAARATGRASALSLGVAGLLGVGLSATPIHGVLLAPFAIAVILLAALNPKAASAPALWRASAVACLTLMAVLSVVYGWGGGAASIKATLLVGSAVVAAAVLAWALVAQIGLEPERGLFGAASTTLLAATLAGYAVGLILLGNTLFQASAPHLDGLWPWSSMTTLKRLVEPIFPDALAFARSPYCDGGYHWADRQLAGHCSSLPTLVGAYGLPFVAVAAAVGWRLLHPGPYQMSDRQAAMTTWTMALCLIALPLGFLLFDFVAPIDTPLAGLAEFSIWARSRLLEPWFYGASTLALAYLLAEAPARARVWLQSALLIATAAFLLNPFVLPAQIAANAAYVVEALGRALLR